MRLVPVVALIAATLVLVGAPVPAPANDAINVELNVLESSQNRCRFAFVVENKGDIALEALKLDLAVFDRDGVVRRRLVTDLGPVRRQKTIVKSFELDGECQVGAILVNDVAACAPADPGACLDRLGLSSRVPGVRLYK
jgi:hypothetical protein